MSQRLSLIKQVVFTFGGQLPPIDAPAFDLVYYDQLANQDEMIVLTVSPGILVRSAAFWTSLAPRSALQQQFCHSGDAVISSCGLLYCSRELLVSVSLLSDLLVSAFERHLAPPRSG